MRQPLPATALLLATAAACARAGEPTVDPGPSNDQDAGVRVDGTEPAGPPGRSPKRDGAVDEDGDDAAMVDGSSPRDTGTGDAHPVNPPGDDGGALPDSGPPLDSGTVVDGGTGTMHPQLAIPPSGQVCATPGASSGCPPGQRCRIATPDSGLCEGSTYEVGLGGFCTTSAECSTIFQCFKHKCTNICHLGTSECGAVADCIDVGHVSRGVCKP